MAFKPTWDSVLPKNVFSHVKYEHLLAGISGGVTSTLILHPLDLLKIRFAGMWKFLCPSPLARINGAKTV